MAPINDPPPTREDMGLLGQIMGQMSADASATTNRLLEIKDAQLRDMEREFLKLYRRMQKVADRTDSFTAYQALQDFGWLADDIERRNDPS